MKRSAYIKVLISLVVCRLILIIAMPLR